MKAMKPAIKFPPSMNVSKEIATATAIKKKKLPRVGKSFGRELKFGKDDTSY